AAVRNSYRSSVVKLRCTTRVVAIGARPGAAGQCCSLAEARRPARLSNEVRARRDAKIWVDADAAPNALKEVVYRAAQRLGIPAVLVANRRLITPLNNPHVTIVWVQGGPDVADRHILAESKAGDVVITADVPLAAELVARDVTVLDTRGELLNA